MTFYYVVCVYRLLNKVRTTSRHVIIILNDRPAFPFFSFFYPHGANAKKCMRASLELSLMGVMMMMTINKY